MYKASAANIHGVTVTVPATTANLGPGFDCLGLALELRNEIRLLRSGTDIPYKDSETIYSIEAHGIDVDKIPRDHSNLAIEAIEKLFCLIERRPETLNLRLKNCIPVGSGLGSSSSAIIAGLVGGNALFENPVPQEVLLRIAVEMEGHPDNVAPALLGGLVLGVLPDAEMGPPELLIQRWDSPDLTSVVVLPDFRLLTSEARAVLPTVVSRSDAIFNISRLGYLINALTTGNFNALRVAMGDKLHQPHRLNLIPGASAAYRAAMAQGALGVALSGAGPSLIAFTIENKEAIAQAMIGAFNDAGLDCRMWLLNPTNQGVTVSTLQTRD